MLYYILVMLSALCYAVQFGANKAYQQKKGSSSVTSLKFIALKGTVAAVVFFFVSWVLYSHPLHVTPMSVILASLASLFGCACWILGFVIFKYGSMSIFSTFLMIGGMTVPFIYSALRGNDLRITEIVGIILLVASLVFPLMGEKKDGQKNARQKVVFALLCLLVFLCNGCMSVVSSIHSGSDFFELAEKFATKIFPDITASRVEGVEFTVLVNIFNAVFCSLALLIISVFNKNKHKSTTTIENGGEGAKVAADMQKGHYQKCYVALLVFACAMLDATAFVLMRIVDASGAILSVKYPLQTALTVVLSAVVGFIAFKEKPSKTALLGLAVTTLSSLLFII